MSHVSPSDLDGVLAVFRDAASAATAIALDFFRQGERTSARIDYKEGNSPVTEADKAIDRLLCERLRTALPEAGWLSEESVDSAERLARRHVLVIDPIDGTRAFLSGDPRWAISIALVTDGRPTVGLVHAPMLDQSFTAVHGGGAFCNDAPIAPSRRTDLAGASIAGPSNFASVLSAPATFSIVPKIPSLACRLAHTAAGLVDACAAGARSHDWDIAAADLIMNEAGAALTDRLGVQPVYNRPEALQPALVGAPPALHRALLSLMRRPGD